MTEEKLIEENLKLSRDNHSLKNVIFLMSITSVVLAGAVIYLAKNQTTILIPPGGDLKGKAVIEKNRADEAYLQWPIETIINRALNLTPSNVRQNLQTILWMVSPDYYASYKADLEKQAAYLEANNLTLSFFTQQTIYEPGRVIVKGLLRKSIGENYAPLEEAYCVIDYKIDSGRFYLTGISKYSKKEYEEFKAKESQKK
jgi:type IV conjugative transfer system protein TraE